MATVKAVKLGTNRGTPTVPSISRNRTPDVAQNRVQQLLERDMEPLKTSPLLGGVLVSGKVPEFDKKSVLIHRLGRAIQGWFVVRVLEPGVVLVEVQSDANTITFQQGYGASVDAAFTLYIF